MRSIVTFYGFGSKVECVENIALQYSSSLQLKLIY